MIQYAESSNVPEVTSWAKWFKTIRIYDGGSPAILTKLYSTVEKLNVGIIKTKFCDTGGVIQAFGILLSKNEYDISLQPTGDLITLHKILNTFESFLDQ
jgi:hypothetical protein